MLCCEFTNRKCFFLLQKSLDDSLGSLCNGNFTSFYASQRLYSQRVIYLNKSNTKWILIGVIPGDPFATAAFFCSKDHQIRIPGELKDFFEILSTLAGVSGSGVLTNATIKAPANTCGDLNITKSDFANGTYKISNTSNRCAAFMSPVQLWHAYRDWQCR